MTTRKCETSSALCRQCVRDWRAAGFEKKDAAARVMELRHANGCFGRPVYLVEVGQAEKRKWMVGVGGLDGDVVLQELKR